MSTPESSTQAGGGGSSVAGTAADRLRILSVEVRNQPGVLARVSGMIRRRGFNIQGLAVGPTNRPGRSRMTLTVDAGHAEVDQVEKQLDRLIEVVEIADITAQSKQVRELVLAKLASAGEQRAQARQAIERLGGRVIDETAEHVMIEIAVESQRVQDVVIELEPYGILELARSGPVAMSRGNTR
jgi:acetolactate synthase I/III small subunit